MTPEFFQSIMRDGGWADLSARAKWLVTGADAVRYLNGQVTNDVRKAAPDAAIHACVTNAKGRIEGDVFIHRTTDGLLLDAEPDLREVLGARLEKYIVADDVTVTDVTEDWKLLHFFGASSEEGRSFPQLVKASRLGAAGIDLWVPASGPVPGFSSPRLSGADVEVLRIIRGIPRWPEELNAEAFPQEAGLENSAMDFSKGCYIGQEVLSRIKSTGKMPRTLAKFQVQGSRFKELRCGAIPPGSLNSLHIFARTDEGTLKVAGTVTSACVHPVLDQIAGLAYVRQGLEREHPLLLATEDPPIITEEVHISGS